MSRDAIFCSLLIATLTVQSTFQQSHPECSTFDLQGGICVAYNECLFSEVRDFITAEKFRQIEDRLFACENVGPKLVCCEKSGLISNKITRTPTTSTTRRTYPTKTQYTLPLSIITTAVTTPAPPSVPAKQEHPNFHIFKDLKCGSGSITRVAYGQDAELFEHPWAVRIGYLKDKGGVQFNCGGSLISGFYVLTAAHCLTTATAKLSPRVIRLGEYDTKTEIDCDPEDDEDCADPLQDVVVESFLAHPQYDASTVVNDLGIIRLAETANFKNKNIHPICLPFDERVQALPNRFITIGWGQQGSSNFSTVLQKATVPLFDQNDCFQKFSALAKVSRKFVLSDRQFCAGGQGKVDTCKGDSGSPIMYVGLLKGKPKFIQYGIVSYGLASCGVKEGFPGIYTEVSKFLPWILDNVQ